MDAIIVVGSMNMTVHTSPVTVVADRIIDKLVHGLVSLFDPATILAPLLNMGNSVTAVAPDYTFSRGGATALA